MAKIKIRLPRRPSAVAEPPTFELSSHYASADARQYLPEIFSGCKDENVYVGLMGTVAMPLLRMEAASGYSGSEICVSVSVDMLRKSWRTWTSAIDAYDLVVGVTLRTRTIGVIYRNPDHTGGVKALRRHAPQQAAASDVADRLEALVEEIRLLRFDLDDNVAPLKRHLAAIVRVGQGLHPTIALQ